MCPYALDALGNHTLGEPGERDPFNVMANLLRGVVESPRFG